MKKEKIDMPLIEFFEREFGQYLSGAWARATDLEKSKHLTFIERCIVLRHQKKPNSIQPKIIKV